jgi:transposase InsO family protein
MLDEQGYQDWCRSLGFKREAKEILDQIRSSPPARRVGGGKKNVAGRYPSRKMGVTIQFESHSNELAAVLEYENDPDCLEFYDQPQPSIPLEYVAKNGKHLRVLHTADFFVLRTASAGWVECKTEQDLVQLAVQSPERFQTAADGSWSCPPGEDYATRFGLHYHLRSSRETSLVYRRNLEFLEEYLHDALIVSESARVAALAAVRAKPGITVAELRQVSDLFGPDEIYALIAAAHLQVDLHGVPLTEAARVPVFCSKEEAEANSAITRLSPQDGTDKRFFVSVVVGQAVSWDGIPWQIVNVGASKIGLLASDGSLVEMPHETLEKLVRAGGITGIFGAHPELDTTTRDKIESAGPDQLQEANRRYEIIRPYLEGEPIRDNVVPQRTIYDWLTKYRIAEDSHGNGLLGLLPRTNAKGNRTSRLPEPTRVLMRDFIENKYETFRQKSRSQVYGALVRACEAQDAAAPSYKTFTKEISRRPQYEQTLKRKGPRAAYPHEPSYLELGSGTPRHGDRPFHICHIDHTELDIELVCSHTGQNLGRPWHTIMTDAFSRRLLASFLSFDPPSYRSCMMVLRECVRRHGRLPQCLVVDGGKEFESVYFDTLLARFECTKKTRPPAKARFGSVCERLFGTSNTQFIHNLAGNTQITKNVRQVTKSVNPKRHAEWTLGRLHDCLSEWAYEVYDTIPHPSLGESPREAFERGLAQSGNRPQRLFAYDEEFRLWTLPTTRRGTALVVPGKGVKINHVFYWASAFREPDVERIQVPVRYDPYDAGTAHAYVHKRWTQCISECYSALHGRSERELMLATAELRRRAQKHAGQFTLTAKKLADFLACAEGDKILAPQRTRDREAKGIVRLISGSLADGFRNDSELEEVAALKPSRELPKTLRLDELTVYEEY